MKNFYLRNIIKSHKIFLVFLALGLFTFLAFANTISIEKVITYSGTYTGDRVIVNGEIPYSSEKIYVYKNRGEKVHRYKVLHKERVDDFTLLYVHGQKSDSLAGNVKIDLVYDQTTLLDVLLKLDFKYYKEKDYY